MDQKNIRNFSIVAHIDHGKSTLADRIMEQTETISDRDTSDQLLDDMSVEKAHGVTVKSKTVRNHYKSDNGEDYEFNFIDTPGHVDFNYEVAKSLAASDGAILLVDATQGVQAQTVANYRLAADAGLKIMPVINKIDSPNAQLEMTLDQISSLMPEVDTDKILKISAKTGLGVHDVLEAIVSELPAPVGDKEAPLKALVFDSAFDPFKGVVAYIRIMDGTLTAATKLKLMANNTQFNATEIGILTPSQVPNDMMTAGDVGYVVTGIKDAQTVRVGDTLTTATNGVSEPLPGYEPAQSMVFAGIYPVGDYKVMKEALTKLALNDSSLQLEPETSDALGVGFRGGFLGVFHLQIIRERLQAEYGVEVITTAPNVTYKAHLKNNKGVKVVDNPVQFPEYSEVEYVEEPMFKVTITTPEDLMSDVMKLAEKSKGTFIDIGNQGDLIELVYKMPLSEVAYSFFNELKSVSHGYASLSSTFMEYEIADVVKVDIHVNYARVDALTFVAHRMDVVGMSQKIVEKLKTAIPKRLYPMPVQAMVEGKSIARSDIPPLRKNVAGGGGHGASKKAAMERRTGNQKSDIELPQEVFNSILDLG